MPSLEYQLEFKAKDFAALETLAGENGLSMEAQVSQWVQERIQVELARRAQESAEWTPQDVREAIDQLERCKTNIYQPKALQALYRLKRIAEEKPMPCLREALPFLRPNWFMLTLPTNYAEIRYTIETATAPWKDLPVLTANDENQESRDLPRPAE